MASNKSLHQKIMNRMEKSQWETQDDFMPASRLKTLVTQRYIQLYFKHNKVAKDVEKYIMTKASKTFLITVLVLEDAPAVKAAMKLLMDSKFSDEKLPIEAPSTVDRIKPRPSDDGASDSDASGSDSWSSEGENELKREFSENGSEKDEVDQNDEESVSYLAAVDDAPLHVIREADPYADVWSTNKIRLFFQDQWKFLAPIISTAEPTQMLSPGTIFPFTKKEDRQAAGGFSRVFRVEIAEGHFEDPNNTMEQVSSPPCFAIKAMNPGPDDKTRKEVRENWTKEARTLHKLNTLRSSHIVKFITALRRESPGSEDYYLILEWADGGSLRDRWKAEPLPSLDRYSIHDTLYQFRGLAQALEQAHVTPMDGVRGNIRHGDLKPENILWFQQEGDNGMLKIGDWGLAKEHFLATHVRTKGTSTRHGTLQYEPPEMVTEMGPKVVSRLYDMWSLGCIFVEYLIWLLYGWNELKRFNKAVASTMAASVPFYEINPATGKAEVHHVVVRWMRHMRKDPACRRDTALNDLLTIIENRLLIVEYDKRAYTRYEPNGDSTLRPPEAARHDDYDLSSDDGEETPSANVKSQLPVLEVTASDGDGRPPTAEPLEHDGRSPGRIRADLLRSLLDKVLERQNDSYWDPGHTSRLGPVDVKSNGRTDYLASNTDSTERRQQNANAMSHNSMKPAGPMRLDASTGSQIGNVKGSLELGLPEMPKVVRKHALLPQDQPIAEC